MLKLSAIDVFSSSINSQKTREGYERTLRRYERLFEITDWDKYLAQNSDTIHDHIMYYIDHHKKRKIKNHTIKGMLNSVFLMLEMNRIPIHKKILLKQLPEDGSILAGAVPFTTDEINKMLSVVPNLRSKALIHFLASTGARPGSITDPVLRMKHIVEMPDGCCGIRIYDNSIEGYWAFLTPEAYDALKSYHNARKINGEIIDDESPLFAIVSNSRSTKGGPMSVLSAREIMERTIPKAGIKRTRVGRRFDKAPIYGFRKRFNTILKLNNSVNSNIAEKLMAHKRGLDGTYLQPTMEECFEEFRKAVLDLTIDDTQRDKIEIEKKEQENTELREKQIELETKSDEIEDLQKKLSLQQENSIHQGIQIQHMEVLLKEILNKK